MKIGKKDIMVSINCITFNQEQFIGKAIESFLMQKADFSFEILIHDDCSTDSTPEIIRKYEEKYPQMIKVIYQKENQYSKGVHVNVLNGKNARGKYMAFCEGDDYWTDSYKLQKQVDFMEQNPEYSLCTHSAILVDKEDKRLEQVVRPSVGNKDFTTEEIILRDGGLFPSNSMLYRCEHFKQLPDFYFHAPIGDYPLAIYLSLKGKVYNLDQEMSAYRVGASGSWSENMRNNIQYFAQQKQKVVKMLQEIDEYTKHQFQEAIYQRTILFQLDKATQLAKNARLSKRIKYTWDCKGLKVKDKGKYMVTLYFYKLCEYLRKMREKR